MSTSQQIINNVEPRSQYVATAGQTVFNTNWTADAASDIDVYLRGEDVAADDQTQLVSAMDYNVEFIGTYQTVRVTFSDPLEMGDIVTIVRNTPSDRENLYTNTNFTPSMLNQDFGILTMVDQQNQMYDQDFCPHYNLSCSYTDDADLAIDLILPILDANQFWVKNADNTAITVATLDNEALPAAGPFVTYTADTSLANAQNLGLLSSGILSQTVTDSSSTVSILPIPLTVPNGGTGSTTFTARGVMLGGTTSTSALRTISTLGTAGQLLTSNGAGADPTWQSSAQVKSVNIVKYTANDTYTKPSNLVFAVIEAIGGGGGGSGTANSGASGFLISGGGGAGGYSKSIYAAADIPSPIAITVGTGGSGGSSGANPGGNGNPSSVGVLCVANGGSGSTTSVAGVGASAGTGNFIAAPGAYGQGGVATSLNTTSFYIGGGASTAWGQGGAPSSAATGAGASASGYGAGGAGATSINAGGAQAGGNGAQGIVIITEFLSG